MPSRSAIDHWYGARVRLRYRYRLYPDAAEREALARSFGCARVVFNDGLRARQQALTEGLPYLSDTELSKRVTAAKATPQRAWLGEVSSVVLQQALADLNVAYRNYFASLSGKAQGPRDRIAPFPVTQGQPAGHSLHEQRPVQGPGQRPPATAEDRRPDRALVTQAPGRTVQRHRDQGCGRPVLRVVRLARNGRSLAALGFRGGYRPGTDRLRHPVGRLQRALSRETKGSNRRRKAVVNVARAHARVAGTRRDWQHKLSTSIIRDNQAVYVEDLCVAGLSRTRLAKSVHDAGWASFTAMLEYKAARHGRTFAKVDRFFPSTRMCSDCGRINDKVALDVRSWACQCGSTHDRGHQRRQEHQGRRAGGLQRPWSEGKTSSNAGPTPRSGNPP